MIAAASFWRRFLAMMRVAIAPNGEEARASWRLPEDSSCWVPWVLPASSSRPAVH